MAQRDFSQWSDDEDEPVTAERRILTQDPASFTHDVGEGDPAFGGDVPMFSVDATSRLRVDSVTEEGVVVHEGYLPGTASETTLVQRWPRAGTFRVTPVDQSGRALGAVRTLVISATNLTLRARLAETAAAGVPGGLGVSSGRSAELEIVNAVIQRQAQELAAERAAMKEERERLAREREALNAEQTKIGAFLAQSTADRYTDIMRQMQVVADNGAALMQNNMMQFAAMINSSAESDRRRQEQQLEAERLRADVRIAEMKAEAEAARERERERANAEIQAARMRLEAEQAAAEARLTRERELNERADQERARMAAENEARRQEHLALVVEMTKQQKNPVNSVIETIGQVSALAGAVGIDLSDVLGGVIGGKATGGILGEVAGLVKEGIKAAPKMIAAMNGAAVEDDGDDDEAEDGIQGPMQAQIAAAAAAPAVAQAPAPAQITQRPPPNTGLANPWGAPAVHAAPAASTPAAQVTSYHPEPSPASDSRIRKALSAMVVQLADQPPDQWGAAVLALAQAEPSLTDYLMRYSVEGALADAGADDGQIDQVIQMMDAFGVDDNIPRRRDDVGGAA